MIHLITPTLSANLRRQVLWLYGSPGNTLEYAAKPLCTRFGRNASAEHLSPVDFDSAALELPAQAGQPWRQGDYQSAVRTLGLSPACVDAIQPHVWGLDTMPALLRVPLGVVFPLPAIAVDALAIHGLRVLSSRGGNAAYFQGGADDLLVARADPFYGTWLVGWVDGGSLIVPSHAGIAFATLTLTAVLMFVYFLVTMAADTLRGVAPSLRLLYLRCCGAKARAGGVKSHDE